MTLDDLSVREGILTKVYPTQLVSAGSGLISPQQVYVTPIDIQTPTSLIRPQIIELVPENKVETNAQNLNRILMRGNIGKRVVLETRHIHFTAEEEYLEQAFYIWKKQRGFERFYFKDRCVAQASIFKVKGEYLPEDSLLRL
ncbi:hypothetical protein HYU08_01420 [Candidatus Woesearchaeota archaeon]|nr:hypothetical protein [Candidatus Woesearchaeota archaeon]